MKRVKIHFFLLIIGSVIYLIALGNRPEINGTGGRTLLEIKSILLDTGKYLVFVALVVGHGLPGVKFPWLYEEPSDD